MYLTCTWGNYAESPARPDLDPKTLHDPIIKSADEDQAPESAFEGTGPAPEDTAEPAEHTPADDPLAADAEGAFDEGTFDDDTFDEEEFSPGGAVL